MNLRSAIQLVRPKQWLKNFLILTPSFFAGEWYDISFYPLLLAVVAFSMLASSIYVLNDITDVLHDKLHPIKKSRPLASGMLSIKYASFLSLFLGIGALAIAYLLGWQILALFLTYGGLNLLYSFYLKNVAILDIVIISLGYIIRLLVGAILTSVLLSSWMIIIVFLLALFLALGKRLKDLEFKEVHEYRKAFNAYNEKFISSAQVMICAIILIAYVMYTISEDVTERIESDYLYITGLPVIMGFLRYFQLSSDENRISDPLDYLIGDKFILLLVVTWILAFFYFLYF